MLFDVTLPNTLRQSHAHKSDHLQSLLQYTTGTFFITTQFNFSVLFFYQNSIFFGVLGNGITSLILLIPVTSIISRSNPKPNPL